MTMFGDILKTRDPQDFLWKEREYADLGVRIGIKARRQVYSDRKLLCNCPVTNPSPDYDVEISRHLRPDPDYISVPNTLSPEPDCPREVVYRLSRKTACTYEMDDSQPVRLNLDVLRNAKALAGAMGCMIPDMTRMMREQILDGSIPSGFQRSMLIGWGCKLPFLEDSLKIQRVTIAEDTARLVENTVKRKVFMTDRLGIPLLVITTRSNLRTPEQAAAAARLLSMVTSAMPGAMHGQDALRFDIRVSIRNGNFVEIRGLQGPGRVMDAAHNEVVRQSYLTGLSGETPLCGTEKRLQLPETDMPAVRLARIEAGHAPDMPWKLAKHMEKQGVTNEDIRALLENRAVDTFLQLTELGMTPVLSVRLALRFQGIMQKTHLINAVNIAMDLGKDPIEQEKLIMRIMQNA